MKRVDDFWRAIREAGDQVDHKLALQGLALAQCPTCKGSGHSEPGRTDWDAHGSYYVSAVDCRTCGGRGRVEVDASKAVRAKAIKDEIARLQKSLTSYESSRQDAQDPRRRWQVASSEELMNAEARGRAAERADVVAWMRDPLNHVTLRTNAGCIERGEHVGAAGKGET